MSDYLAQKLSSLLKLVAPNSDPGCALQLLKPIENGYEMDKVTLMNLVKHPAVKNNPVVIISICGAKREGKSFLLSLLIKYLESNMQEAWLNEPDTPIPTHFSWKSGRKAHTQGIWLWSKPYLIQKSNGHKVAVILFDTEGAYSSTGKQNDSDIFAFSTLLSSVQIYNMKDEINEQKLESLAAFTSYTERAGTKTESGQIFQSLMLLVRDWTDDEFQCGVEGGRKYMEEELQNKKVTDEDLIAIRDKISKVFRQVECTLLPYPGAIVDNKDKRHRQNTTQVKDMSGDFKEHLRIFFHILLDECTEPKEVGGRIIKGDEILNLSTKLFNLLRTKEIFNVSLTLKELDAAKAQTLIQQLQKEYDEKMLAISRSYCSETTVDENHKEYLHQAMEKYNNEYNTSYTSHKNRFKQLLIDAITNLLNKHKQIRSAEEGELRKKYEDMIEEILTEHWSQITGSGFQAFGTKLKDLNSVQCELGTDAYYYEYNEKLMRKIGKAESRWESIKQLSEMQRDCINNYKKIMEKVIKNDFLTKDGLEKQNQICRKKTIKRFKANCELKDALVDDIQKQSYELDQQLSEQYKAVLIVYQEYMELKQKEFEADFEKVKKSYMEYIDMITRNKYLQPDDLQIVHDNFIKMMICELKKLDSATNMKSEEENQLITYTKQQLTDQYKHISDDMEKRKEDIREVSHEEVMELIKKIIYRFEKGVWKQNWFMYWFRQTFQQN
ncbi:atlastin-3-like isoform X2 [Clavelina lepadiformis]|uniref:atlastin-3-like isoform X2 n=1 Tax=Clavelina lepadiformis TaxID=159417 RepID=UPI0040412B50